MKSEKRSVLQFTFHQTVIGAQHFYADAFFAHVEKEQDWINQYYKSLRKLEVRKTAQNDYRFKLSYGQK